MWEPNDQLLSFAHAAHIPLVIFRMSPLVTRKDTLALGWIGTLFVNSIFDRRGYGLHRTFHQLRA